MICNLLKASTSLRCDTRTWWECTFCFSEGRSRKKHSPNFGTLTAAMLSLKAPYDLCLSILFCHIYMPSPAALKGTVPLGHCAIKRAQLITTHDSWLISFFYKMVVVWGEREEPRPLVLKRNYASLHGNSFVNYRVQFREQWRKDRNALNSASTICQREKKGGVWGTRTCFFVFLIGFSSFLRSHTARAC